MPSLMFFSLDLEVDEGHAPLTVQLSFLRRKDLIAVRRGVCQSARSRPPNINKGSAGRFMTTVAFGGHLGKGLVKLRVVLCFDGFTDLNCELISSGYVRCGHVWVETRRFLEVSA